MPISPVLSSLLAGFFSLFLATASQAVTLYKWVDAEGNISYQDRPPPSGQQYEQKSYSRGGARTGETDPDIARERATRENPITLYRAQNCDSCDVVSAILEANRAPFREIVVDNNREAQRKLASLIGALRVPVLTIGGKTLDSVDRILIEKTLSEAGYPQVKPDKQ